MSHVIFFVAQSKITTTELSPSTDKDSGMWLKAPEKASKRTLINTITIYLLTAITQTIYC